MKKNYYPQVTGLLALLLILFLGYGNNANAQTIFNFAGHADGTSGDGPDGPAVSAGLNNPRDIYVDPAGNVYFTDFQNNKIRKVSTAGIISTVAGDGTGTYPGDGVQATSAGIYQPIGMTIDHSGNMYIVLVGNVIYKVDPSGIISTVAGTGVAGYNGDGIQATTAQIDSPIGVVCDVPGNIYFADHNNKRVREINISTGIISTVAGGGPDASVYYSGPATGADIGQPHGMAIDVSGNIYFANNGANGIVREYVPATGMLTTIAGGATGYTFPGPAGDGGPATAAQFDALARIAFDGNGDLYVADQGSDDRVRKINITTGTIGDINAAAGTGAMGNSGDGSPALAATFSGPAGMGADNANNFYIADRNNNRIRRVCLGTLVATAPTIAASSAFVLAGSSVVLTVTGGSLNNSVGWSWYSGGCGTEGGGTNVGTGASITVNPAVTTTYYVRGEGGCAGLGACSSITVNVITSCLTSSLIINTGYDPVTGTAITPGANGATPVHDPHWFVSSVSADLITAGASAGDIVVTPPGSADVINRNGAWIPNPAGQPGGWISCLNSQCFFTSTPHVYTTELSRTFNMCYEDDITFNLFLSQDDLLDGFFIDGVAYPLTGATFSEFLAIPSITLHLGCGPHTISFLFENANFVTGCNPMGLNVYGTVTSADNSIVSESGACLSYACTLPPISAATATVCKGSTISLSDAIGSGTWSTDVPTVATVDGSGNVTGVSPGTTVVTFTYNPCLSTSIVVTVNALPSAGNPASPTFIGDVTGGGRYCAGGVGAMVGVESTQTGVNYQLYQSPLPSPLTPIGSPIAGTGQPVHFGYQTEPGYYTVIATNASTGCQVTLASNAVVSNLPVPDVDAVADQVDCNGTPQPTITFSGSDPGTTFLWTNDNTAIGLGSGGTTGTICGTANEETMLTMTAPPGAVFTAVIYANYGQNAGSCGSFVNFCGAPNTKAVVESYLLGNNSATIPVNNGTFNDYCFTDFKNLYVQATYTYVGDIASFGATNAGTSLISGTITVTPYANGCVGTPETFSITVNPSPTAGTVTGGPAVCAGSETAAPYTDAGAANGTGAWSSDNTLVAAVDAGGNVTGLSSGTANIIFTVTSGFTPSCGTASNSAPITVNPLPIAGTVTGGQAVCVGSSTAFADAGAANGTGAWSSDNTLVATVDAGGNVTGLSAGSANIIFTVTSGFTPGCGTAAASAPITVNPLPVFATHIDNVSCHGLYDGHIDADVSGGTAPYSYSWTTGGAGFRLYDDLYFAPAGTYTVTATDAHGCAVTGIYTITQPAALALNGTATNVVCYGAHTGSINTTVAGGTPGYNYFWSSGSHSADPSGLGAGVYSVIVTDAHGCATGGSYNITQPPAISISAAVANVSCNGSKNGSITTTVSGGKPGYSYSWSNGSHAASITGLAPGTYSLTVTDANGCTATHSYTITQPAVLAVSCSASPVYCFSGGAAYTIYLGYGPSSVTLSASASGGTAGYTYSWSPGSGHGSSMSVSPTTTTTYTVTVKDAHGCTSTCTETIYVIDIRCSDHKLVFVCHHGSTISCGTGDVPGHLGHGDYCGPCHKTGAKEAPGGDDNGEPTVGDVSGDGIRIYPNPTESRFYIEIPAIHKDAQVVICDLTGKVIESRVITDNTGQPVPFSLNNVARGIYVVKVIAGDTNYVEKVIAR